MKIGITGDTHGSQQAMRKLLSLTPPVALWLQTGGHPEDANLLQNLTGIQTVSVRGNCDFFANDTKVDEFLVLEDYKLWLTHGHKYIQWKVTADLGYWAKALDQDIVVFGHTHVPLCEYYGDTLLINPGSPSRPRGGSNPSFAVLTLQKGATPEVEFFKI